MTGPVCWGAEEKVEERGEERGDTCFSSAMGIEPALLPSVGNVVGGIVFTSEDKMGVNMAAGAGSTAVPSGTSVITTVTARAFVALTTNEASVISVGAKASVISSPPGNLPSPFE